MFRLIMDDTTPEETARILREVALLLDYGHLRGLCIDSRNLCIGTFESVNRSTDRGAT